MKYSLNPFTHTKPYLNGNVRIIQQGLKHPVAIPRLLTITEAMSTRYPLNWKGISRDIRKRDNYKCRVCGGKKKLQAHHINFNKSDCYELNLITLCHWCHHKSTFNRDYWYKYLYKLMHNAIAILPPGSK